MQFTRSLALKIAAAGLALAGASMAQARSDVHWSLGLNLAPGVVVGASNSPYYAPAPVYGYGQPVYSAPQVVYSQPYPYYAPAPVVYVRPAPVYYGGGYYGGHRQHIRGHRGHGHRGHNGHGHR